jgi:hypothetical protein
MPLCGLKLGRQQFIVVSDHNILIASGRRTLDRPLTTGLQQASPSGVFRGAFRFPSENRGKTAATPRQRTHHSHNCHT